MSEQPRGLRNNNPGNIRHSKVKWQGQADAQPDPAFVTFTSPQFGIRALAKTLITYQATHGLKTIEQMIGRWAPPNENNTPAYVKAVAEAVAVPASMPVAVDAMRIMLPMVAAIIRHENGSQPYSDAILRAGLRLAGVSDAAPKPLLLSKRFVGAAGSTIASAGVAVIAASAALQPTVASLHDQLAPMAAVSPTVGKAVAALGLIGAVLSGLSAFSHAMAHRDEGV